MGAPPFCSWDRRLSSYPLVHCRQQSRPAAAARPNGEGSMSGGFPIDDDDLPATLCRVIERVERHLRSPP